MAIIDTLGKQRTGTQFDTLGKQRTGTLFDTLGEEGHIGTLLINR